MHVELLTSQYVRAGIAPGEARRMARVKFGGVGQIKESLRDQAGFPMLESIIEDVRYAVRGILKNPGFVLVVVLTLGVGIGANTAIFSVVNTVLLEPLPYPEPSRLVVLQTTGPQRSFPIASPTKFNVWREHAGVLRDVSAYLFNTANLTGGEPEQIVAGSVTADFFRLFGATTVAGRTFSADEDRPNGGRVVVLGHGFWQRRFGGAADIVGGTLPIGGDAHTVLGVLGPFDTEALQGPEGAPDVYLPFRIDPNSAMNGHFFRAVGRLAPGASVESATAGLQPAAETFRQRFPDVLTPNQSFGVRSFPDLVVGNVRSSLWILMAAVSLVLLIACANVANLLLVRAAARKRELAVRAALGAGRFRIARQLLTEGLVLSAAGGVLGLGVGMLGIRLLLAVNPGNIPRIGPAGAGVDLDWRVLAFTVALSLATSLVFGTLPALRASRTDLTQTLKESSSRTGSGFRQQRARALLVVSEVGLALVLLVGAALFIRTFFNLRAVDPGFDARRVLTMNMSLGGGRFDASAAIGDVMRAGRERLTALPGVEAAAAACCIPLRGGLGLPFVIEGRPLEGPFHGGGAFTPISAGYFEAFGIPLVRGRALTDRDDGGAAPVVVINEAMARQFWPDGDPLADRITIAKGRPVVGGPTRQVVGIVGDVRDGRLDVEPRPTMYVPWAQVPDAHNANLVSMFPLSWIVRTRGAPQALGETIRDELRVASGGIPVAGLLSMEAVVSRSTARSDFLMFLLTIFAGAALVLAAIGIYGLSAYSVEQRTQEIGIRLAMGADSDRVRNLVIRQGMAVALVGVALGIASAYGLSRLVAGFLFEVAPRDPVVFAAVPLLLAAVALAGVWLPARRAARVEPAAALRLE
ncbi:MAG: ABC transporter permease [Acidobacteria bacterium]|nr:ABC transporter permease [Acidobacteriota bacterium]